MIANRLLGNRFVYPVDFNLSAFDGHRWLGESKTFRGIILATATTALSAVVIGYSWELGAVIGVLAMAGDLISSFIKRRMGMDVSSQAAGLDQVPEALLPLAVCAAPLGLEWLDVMILVGAFWVLELLLSRLLYKLHIRKQPY